MKKIILAIALFTAVSANAQSDGFFSTPYNQYREGTSTGSSSEWGMLPSMIGHGLEGDQSAPLGSGLLLLAGMSLAYGMRKKSK